MRETEKERRDERRTARRRAAADLIVGRRLFGGRGSSRTCLQLGSLRRRSSWCKFYFQNFLFPLFTYSVYACSGGVGGV